MGKIVRMCISCRERFIQNELFRVQCKDKKLMPYTKYGRSFYICPNCLDDKQTVLKAIYRQCKNKDENYLKILMEL